MGDYALDISGVAGSVYRAGDSYQGDIEPLPPSIDRCAVVRRLLREIPSTALTNLFMFCNTGHAENCKQSLIDSV